MSKELPKTSLTAVIQVGIQKLTHTFVDMEIFDCKKVMDFPKLKTDYRFQMDKMNQQTFSIVGGFKSNSEECVISKYSLTTKRNDIKLDTTSGLIKFGYKFDIPRSTM